MPLRCCPKMPLGCWSCCPVKRCCPVPCCCPVSSQDAGQCCCPVPCCCPVKMLGSKTSPTRTAAAPQWPQRLIPSTSVVSFRETSFHFSQKSTKVNYKAGLKLGIYAQRWLSTDYKLTNDLKKFTGAVLIREVGQGLELHILQWNWSSQSFKEQFAIVVSTSYTTI